MLEPAQGNIKPLIYKIDIYIEVKRKTSGIFKELLVIKRLISKYNIKLNG